MTFSDVELMAVDVTNLIPAFQNRNVDAALYWEPWMSRLVQAGGDVLMTNWQAKQPSATMWMARTKWLEQNASAAVAFVRGLNSVVDDIRNSPAKVAATVSPELGLDAASLTKVLTHGARFPTVQEMLDPGYVYSIAPQAVAAEKGLAKVIKDVATFMKDLGVVDRVPDVKSAFYAQAAQAVARS
jgi:ABC-type nitrate/sulfonate/bicarbonate transport system substrate-binding protein